MNLIWKRLLENPKEWDHYNTSENDPIAKKMAICNAVEKAAACIDSIDLSDAFIQVIIEDDHPFDELMRHLGCQDDLKMLTRITILVMMIVMKMMTLLMMLTMLHSAMMIHHRAATVVCLDSSSMATMIPLTMEVRRMQFIIGGEDQTARLPGEPIEPPRGRVRMDYMQQ